MAKRASPEASSAFAEARTDDKNVKPTQHKMQHLPVFAAAINPRFLQCYAEESLVGTSAVIWRKTMAGQYHRVAQRTVLVKRFVGLLLRLELLSPEQKAPLPSAIK